MIHMYYLIMNSLNNVYDALNLLPWPVIQYHRWGDFETMAFFLAHHNFGGIE